MKEIWKDVVGYEGLYQVSNLGRVKSLSRIVTTKNGAKRVIREIIMKPVFCTFGYPCVSLRKDYAKKTKLIHRLVADAFIPNPNNYPVVNHKDENRSNCNVDNLEWCTQQYNSVCNGLQLRKRWCNIIRAVLQYDKNGILLKEWDSISEAARFYNIPPNNISRCCKGITKTCHKFIWKYKIQEL